MFFSLKTKDIAKKLYSMRFHCKTKILYLIQGYLGWAELIYAL